MSSSVVLPAKWVAILHTSIAVTAFATALFSGWVSGLWQELCINSVSQWPVEWFPSVSATVGDHAATRAPFQILIALCATPRFCQLILQWSLHRQSSLANVEAAVGFMRTVCCGGWMFITSSDHHDLHDLFMIVYLILNVPWMVLTASNSTGSIRTKRYAIFAGFLATIPPLLWQYHRHAVQRIPGAYTTYASFEWGLVVWDIAFDSVSIEELGRMEISVQGGTRPKSRSAAEMDWTIGSIPATAAQGFLAYLSDLYFGITFWTVFTALPFQLFYWSVWKLALSGSELALFANVAPFLLCFSTVWSFASSQRGIATNRCLTVILGIGGYCLPTPLLRLFAVALAMTFGWLALLGNLLRLKGSQEMVTEGQVLTLALAITALLKHFNTSVNPFWLVVDETSGGWNKTGLFLGLLCTLETSLRPAGAFGAPPIGGGSKGLGLGLGALLHLVHTFATDGGTIIAWVWTGFPINGPTYPQGAVVVAVMAIASALELASAWSIFGVLSCVTLYRMPGWFGFGGGVCLVFFLVGSLPRYLQLSSAKTFGIAMLVYCILGVLSVVTTAYAFVPFGWLLRERTDLLLAVSMLAVVLDRPRPAEHHLRPQSVQRMTWYRNWQRPLAVAIAAIAMSSLYKFTPTPIPYYPEHRIFSGGIWTVHFGVDAAGRDSQRRMMELIRDMQVDVVGLLESDLHHFVYGNRDLTRIITEELGYYVDLGPGPNKHTWGAALLSKFPIVNSTHHLLPSPHGELAPAIHATLDIHGEMVNVFVSHNGQEEDALDRELQTTEIARILAESDAPTIFLGYLVTKPGDKRPWPYQILMEDGRMNDIEKSDRWRWCEYIAFRGLWRIGYARVHESDISDTELQVGKFMLPKPGTKAEYENDKEMYWHIGEDDIPEPWRMPAMFRDEGVRGHRYVVWVGPVYYMPPDRSGLTKYGLGWAKE